MVSCVEDGPAVLGPEVGGGGGPNAIDVVLGCPNTKLPDAATGTEAGTESLPNSEIPDCDGAVVDGAVSVGVVESCVERTV